LHPGFNHGGRFHNQGFASFVPWGGYYYQPYIDYNAEAQAQYEAEQAAAREQQDRADDQLRQQALQKTIDDLRAYNEQRDRELEQERLARESSPPQPQLPAGPALILIFKDGHRAEVSNYAIMGSTFYDLSDGRPRKIPLADLDLDATTRINDQNGVDFRLPGTRKPA
jgi:multidrug efflux pump subunit AcrA (membrane-fusion protein)